MAQKNDDPVEEQYKRMYESSLRTVLNSKQVSEGNKNVILDFIDKCHADGIKTKRIVKLIGMVRKLAEWADKDFAEFTEKDVTKLIADKIERGDFKDWTKWSYKRVIKKLFKFLKKEDIIKDIKVSFKKEERISPDEVLEPDDIRKMLEAAENPRDKAIVSLLAEIGMRSEEARRLKISHLLLGENPKILVPGVKESPKIRELPVVDSVPYLTRWLEIHPGRKDPESYLFVSLSINCRNRMLSHTRIFKLITGLKERTGITKPCYPHALRHAAASRLGRYFNESQLNWWFGWKAGSRMAGEYVHLGQNHIQDAYYRMRGVCVKCKKNDALPKSDFCDVCIGDCSAAPRRELEPVKCPRCDTPNEATALLCKRCSLGLDPKARTDYDKSRSESAELRKQLEDMRGFKDRIEELIKEAVESRIKELGISI